MLFLGYAHSHSSLLNVQIKHHIKGFWAMILNILRGSKNCPTYRERSHKREIFGASKRTHCRNRGYFFTQT